MSPRKKHDLPDVPALSENLVQNAFPGGFTIRDEANALTAYAFRNGELENLHAGAASPLTDDPNLSRITDAKMKELMIEASGKLAALLAFRDRDPDNYKRFVQAYGFMFCREWNR